MVDGVERAARLDELLRDLQVLVAEPRRVVAIAEVDDFTDDDDDDDDEEEVVKVNVVRSAAAAAPAKQMAAVELDDFEDELD